MGDSLGRASKIVIAKIDYIPPAELREPTKDELWYHKLNRARQTRWTRQCSSLPPDPNRKYIPIHPRMAPIVSVLKGRIKALSLKRDLGEYAPLGFL